ncbi:MAG: hypothetical protein J5755_05745, partial [Clostridia bacterium]|nr:hypothetical protein [Clostridia bacterium]
MKKLLATLIIVTMLAGIACVAVGCYNSKPAVMKELVGTYELTQFTRWHTENQGEESTTQETDLKAERGIQAYLVVKDNGRGYFVYKDNGGLTAREVAITYTYDDKNTNQIKEITYTDGLASSGDGYPGKGRETLGLTFGLKEKTLNFYYAQINGKLIKRDYSQKVVYKKVSKSADLSYVESKLQVRLNIPRMEIGGLDGWQVYDSYNESNPLVYFYIDMHVAEGQATIYYMFRSDGIRHQENCALTFDVPEDNSQPIAIHVGDDVFYAYNYVTTIPSTIW